MNASSAAEKNLPQDPNLQLVPTEHGKPHSWSARSWVLLLAVPTLPGSLKQSDTTQDTPRNGSGVSRMEGKVGAGQSL